MNPALDLELPTPESRKRAATPAQALELLETLGDLRPLWATAFYAGLRRGELQALRVRNVDVEADTLGVEKGWDPIDGEILPKSEAGVRQVFLLDTLQPLLTPLVEDRPPDAFVFGGPTSPFDARSTGKTAAGSLTEPPESPPTNSRVLTMPTVGPQDDPRAEPALP